MECFVDWDACGWNAMELVFSTGLTGIKVGRKSVRYRDRDRDRQRDRERER